MNQTKPMHEYMRESLRKMRGEIEVLKEAVRHMEKGIGELELSADDVQFSEEKS